MTCYLGQMLCFTMGYMLICVVCVSAVVRKSRFFPSPPLENRQIWTFPELVSLYSSSPLQLDHPKIRVVRQKCSIIPLHPSLPSQKTTDITLLHPLCGSKGPIRGGDREKSAARSH